LFEIPKSLKVGGVNHFDLSNETNPGRERTRDSHRTAEARARQEGARDQLAFGGTWKENVPGMSRVAREERERPMRGDT